MTRPAELPPIDLSRTWCDPDGMTVEFFGPDTFLIASIRSHAAMVNIWDHRTVATLFRYPGRFVRELLPDGRAVAFAGRDKATFDPLVVETGEDFSQLLDLAIAAGLVVEPPR